jgi:hypothetical protein
LCPEPCSCAHQLRNPGSGIAPGSRIEPDAAAVIRERTGTDSSSHEPTNLTDRKANDYDAVVVLDRVVARDVVDWIRPNTPLFVWDVPDPYHKGLPVYEETADAIEALIGSTFLSEAAPKRLWSGARPDADGIAKLVADIAKWRGAVAAGAAPSHCNGMAASASRNLEQLLKSLLAARIAALGLTVSEVLDAVHAKGDRHSVRTWAFGTVVSALGWLAKRDEELRGPWQDGFGKAAGQVVELRNTEIHEAKDMAAGTLRLLDAVQKTIADRRVRALMRAHMDVPPNVEE